MKCNNCSIRIISPVFLLKRESKNELVSLVAPKSMTPPIEKDQN